MLNFSHVSSGAGITGPFVAQVTRDLVSPRPKRSLKGYRPLRPGLSAETYKNCDDAVNNGTTEATKGSGDEFTLVLSLRDYNHFPFVPRFSQDITPQDTKRTLDEQLTYIALTH
jgi:hypothetical protein